MDFFYKGKTKLRLRRYQPHRKNTCYLAVAVNAVNYFRGQEQFTTEKALEEIDKWRLEEGKPPLDLDIDCLTDDEFKRLLVQYGGGIFGVEFEGKEFLRQDLWRAFVEAGFILVIDHQMLYADPKAETKKNLNYLPKSIARKAVSDPNFSYKNLIDLYKFIIDYRGALDEGHEDIVLDVKKINGEECVVLGNFMPEANESPVFVPWNFFCNYLTFSVIGDAPKNIAELPDEKGFIESLSDGETKTANGSWLYGWYGVYFPQGKVNKFMGILDDFGIKISLPQNGWPTYRYKGKKIILDRVH